MLLEFSQVENCAGSACARGQVPHLPMRAGGRPGLPGFPGPAAHHGAPFPAADPVPPALSAPLPLKRGATAAGEGGHLRVMLLSDRGLDRRRSLLHFSASAPRVAKVAAAPSTG